MKTGQQKIQVYYDGSCSQCVRDRDNYERLAGKGRDAVCWVDITGKEEELRELGIDPAKALKELHIRDEQDRVLSEIDAYIVLLRRIPLLVPLGLIIGLPVIRPCLSRLYRIMVDRRLRRERRTK